jgi:hypothetical protein
VRWDPLLDGTVLAEGREVNAIAYRYKNPSCCASTSCGGSLPPDGSLWREEYQGEAVQDQRSTRAEAPSKLPTYPYLRTKSRLEQIHGVSRLPPRPCWEHTQEPWVLAALAGGSWGLVGAPPDTYRGVLWPAGGSSLLHSAVLASISIP